MNAQAVGIAHPEYLADANTDPWFWPSVTPSSGDSTFDHRKDVPFLVRLRGSKELLGVVLAADDQELFDIIDEVVDPYACEATVLAAGGAVFFDPNRVSENWERFAGMPRKYWRRPFDPSLHERQLRSAEIQARGLRSLITGLKGITDAKHRATPR